MAGTGDERIEATQGASIAPRAWIGLAIASALGLWSLAMGLRLWESRTKLKESVALVGAMLELEDALLTVERESYDSADMTAHVAAFHESAEELLRGPSLRASERAAVDTAVATLDACEDLRAQLLGGDLTRDEGHRLGAEYYDRLSTATGAVHTSARAVEAEQARQLERQIAENARLLPLTLVACVLALAMWLVLERHRRARAALARERQRLDVTLDSITDVVLTTDLVGNVVLANRAAEELLAGDRRLLVGRSVTDVLADDGGGAGLGRDASVLVRQTLSAGRRRPIGPLRVPNRDGEARLVEGSISPLTDGHNNPQGTVLVLADVTESEQRSSEQGRLEKLDSLGVLAGGIAHDFNNLLTGLLGNVSLALQELEAEHSARPPRASHQARRCLADALGAGNEARGLTQQLLTFARGGEPVKKRVQAAELLRETCALSLRGAAVRAEFALDDSLADFDADPHQLAQVFQNITLNAKQAMPGGGVLRVAARNIVLPSDAHPALASLGPGTYIEVRFADDGPGIATADLKRIFDPYFTTKEGGTGLGLSTAHSIVRRHGGHLSVLPPLSGGSTFVVTLPAVSHRTPPSSGDWSPPAGGMPGIRVLVMDDEDVVRTVACRMLERLGCRVESCAQGSCAVEACREALAGGDPFDAALLDLTVPGGMGGKEAAAHLRALDPELHLIVTSGYCEDPVMARFREHGFDRAVAKPFQTKDLLACLAPIADRAPRSPFAAERSEVGTVGAEVAAPATGSAAPGPSAPGQSRHLE